jgi:hypothetical protein
MIVDTRCFKYFGVFLENGSFLRKGYFFMNSCVTGSGICIDSFVIVGVQTLVRCFSTCSRASFAFVIGAPNGTLLSLSFEDPFWFRMCFFLFDL